MTFQFSITLTVRTQIICYLKIYFLLINTHQQLCVHTNDSIYPLAAATLMCLTVQIGLTDEELQKVTDRIKKEAAEEEKLKKATEEAEVMPGAEGGDTDTGAGETEGSVSQRKGRLEVVAGCSRRGGRVEESDAGEADGEEATALMRDG